MKKRFFLGAILIASLFVFAACNNDDEDGDASLPYYIPERNPLAR